MSDITKIAVEDLIEKPLKDLLALQTKVVKAIDLRRDTEKLDLAKKIQQMAAESGFTLEELSKIKIKGERKQRPDAGKKAEPKYRNPNKFEQTWSGRGLKPKWLQQLIDDGASLESFKI